MRFFRVKNGETTVLGRRTFTKLSFCTAILNGETVGAQHIELVNPFRRVKTATPVKRPFFDAKSSNRPEGVQYTHFVGDECPGGHHELPRTAGSMEIRHGDEPNNANNITGPTC